MIPKHMGLPSLSPRARGVDTLNMQMDWVTVVFGGVDVVASSAKKNSTGLASSCIWHDESIAYRVNSNIKPFRQALELLWGIAWKKNVV